MVKCKLKWRRHIVKKNIDKDEGRNTRFDRLVPGELQPYDPNNKSELTETGEDETEEDPFQMTDEELEDKLKEF
jgi:hypothetical protein